MAQLCFPGTRSAVLCPLETRPDWTRLDRAGHNSNYLLELSPDPRGRIPPADAAAYRGFGEALERCYKGPHAAQSELRDQRGGPAFELPAAVVVVDRVLIEEVCGGPNTLSSAGDFSAVSQPLLNRVPILRSGPGRTWRAAARR